MTIAEEAEAAGLQRVGAREPFPTYVREVWLRRSFIYRLARYRIEARNAQHRLGMAWVILDPIIDVIVYGTVFGYVLMRGNIPHHYILFLIIGVFFFDFFGGCFTSGAKSITSNASLVQSLSFPRMALPLAHVTQKFLEFVPMVGIIFIATLVDGFRPSKQWLLMIPVLILFTIFCTGVTLITARLTVHFQDLTQILPFVSRLLFYTSGVFYSMELQFPKDSTFLKVAQMQPTHQFLTLAREAFGDGPGFDARPEFWIYATVWAFATIIIGSIFFWSAEEKYGRVD